VAAPQPGTPATAEGRGRLPGNPIYVVEPHSDDAFLSVGWSVKRWIRDGSEVVIVTVYSADPHRAEEAQRWADHVGARWVGLGHHESGVVDLERGVTGKAPPLPAPLLPDEVMAPSASRIWPLGLSHPEHLAVAAAAPAGDLRYIDTPYQLDLYEQAKIRSALIGRTIAWWLRPPKKKWDAAPIFASQAVLFDHFPPAKLEWVPEIVVQ
jgi:hypothetical protein